MIKYKHYIKINDKNEIILSFSSWQKEHFDGTEIFIEESKERHYQLNVEPNMEDVYPFKYIDGKIKCQ